jgi:SAM-dependent methyltransferase
MKNILHEYLPFGGFFNTRRLILVNKLESLFGIDWFRGKKILELGCGTGRIGRYFGLLGADVTFCDARPELLNLIKIEDENAKCIELNNETNWALPDHYDLILHLGLSYNLDNWEQDLRCSINQGKIIVFESGVCRFSDKFEAKIIEPKYDFEHYGPFSKVGTLVSSANIQDVLSEKNKKWIRYDDKNLNGANFFYDWKENDIGYEETKSKKTILDSWNDPFYFGGRRFWVIQ